MTDTTARKPRDDEIDVAGLTHVGKVRKDNQDHFLLASLNKRLEVLSTSITDTSGFAAVDQRIAFLAMVADGVGGRSHGEEASRIALEQATLYLSQSAAKYSQAAAQHEEFIDLLQATALASHEKVMARVAESPAKYQGMATTLTLWFGVWPWYYLLQVGDSRYYLYREGTLTQITRDQTMAEDLVDRGVLKRSQKHRSPLSNILSSAIGAQQTTPVVTRIAAAWENVHLVCSDGLTKHVSDERIAERLANMTSAQQACEALLQDALDDGGSDNITIVIGRAVRRDQP